MRQRAGQELPSKHRSGAQRNRFYQWRADSACRGTWSGVLFFRQGECPGETDKTAYPTPPSRLEVFPFRHAREGDLVAAHFFLNIRVQAETDRMSSELAVQPVNRVKKLFRARFLKQIKLMRCRRNQPMQRHADAQRFPAFILTPEFVQESQQEL